MTNIIIANSAPKARKGDATLTWNEHSGTCLKEQPDGTRALEVGMPKKSLTTRSLRIFVRKVVEEAKRARVERLIIQNIQPAAHNLVILDEELAELFAHNILLALYQYTTYKTSKDSLQILTDIVLVAQNETCKRGYTRGITIAECVNEARTIANTPGGDMTPDMLGKATQVALRGTSARVRVLKRSDIHKLKMGALLGVSKGSSVPPAFIIIEYKGSSAHDAPLVFVGKGITFDTGGLSLKPGDAMLDMHLDMSGGAAVIGALKAIARLKLKRNVIGLIPAAENMVSGESYRPGDILTSMAGKTVEVLNTDAEGRLVLADALTYAGRYKPALVVDVATLTGAALVALGQHASVLMTHDDTIAETLIRFGEASGNYLWRLPLWDEYIKYTKGTHADLANIQSSGNVRYGGAINGGAFLSHFASAYPWAHIDMAPRMTPAPGDHLAKGATGEPVALLVKIAESYTEN
jgi:leucyl aminopeptidase